MKAFFVKFSAWGKRKIRILLVWAKRITLPGFDGQSLHTVGLLFLQGLSKGYIADRAASVAFNFFTALFPLLLMVFTLIPYIPIDNFQNDILQNLESIIPLEIWNILEGTITYIITRKSAGLLSIGFIFSLLFATGGISSLFSAFNQTYHSYTTAANFLKQRWYALIILLATIFIIGILITILSFGNKLIVFLLQDSPNAFGFVYYLFQSIRMILASLVVVFAIALIYYFALLKPRVFNLFSPGSILCSLLMIITTLGFSFFISNFSRYNILYGSLGTILILTMYLYVNSIFILIGFEINRSIDVAKKK